MTLLPIDKSCLAFEQIKVEFIKDAKKVRRVGRGIGRGKFREWLKLTSLTGQIKLISLIISG